MTHCGVLIYTSIRETMELSENYDLQRPLLTKNCSELSTPMEYVIFNSRAVYFGHTTQSALDTTVYIPGRCTRYHGYIQ